ncbi:MAG: prolipoprotein diacylglyceryl transferase [Nanoarchaeota archaeon]|nr:prolipoprotein diacylglyceryl transferase [Nanoarchaeota archaeon]
MIPVNINPIIFRLGSFQLTYYALNFLLGFVVSLIVLLQAIKNKKIKITKEQAYDLIILLLIGIVVGARLFHIIFWNLIYFKANPIEIFYIWQGGLSLHGGILGAFIVGIIFTRKNKIDFWKLADILVLPAIFMLALGRIANFINVEILGKVTLLPWCVQFVGIEGCRHPIQLYAAAGRFALFFLLLAISRKKNQKPGFIFWLFITLMGIGRFFLDFLRIDTHYLGLNAGQWLSIAMFIIGSFALIKYYKRDLKSLLHKVL